jgi:hypothetical protein
MGFRSTGPNWKYSLPMRRVSKRKHCLKRWLKSTMRHFGVTPRTTAVGAKEQNGDVEAGHRALKSALEQALLLRGSRDFVSVDAWQFLLDGIVRKCNKSRGARVAEDLAAMREITVKKLPDFEELGVRVSEWSTIRVKYCAYSVPSRLIGEWVRVRLFKDKLEVYFAKDVPEMFCERVRGRGNRIDYRHIVWSLLRKPGGFERYVYREEMFPSVAFRRAYDRIQTPHQGIGVSQNPFHSS